MYIRIGGIEVKISQTGELSFNRNCNRFHSHYYYKTKDLIDISLDLKWGKNCTRIERCLSEAVSS